MDRNLRIFWIASFLILLAAVVVSTGRTSKSVVDYITTYQTLLTGLLAVGAAVWTIQRMNRAMNQEREIQEETRQRDLEAARAVLPPTLTKLIEYSETCIAELERTLDETPPAMAARNLVLVPTDFAVPTTPDEILYVIRDCIRSADRDRARELQELVATLQIQNSRLRAFSRGETEARHWAFGRVLDAGEVHARTSALFEFARNRPDPDRRSLRERVRSSLNVSHIVLLDTYPELDHMLSSSWAPILQRDHLS
jgi:hypothetical protein